MSQYVTLKEEEKDYYLLDWTISALRGTIEKEIKENPFDKEIIETKKKLEEILNRYDDGFGMSLSNSEGEYDAVLDDIWEQGVCKFLRWYEAYDTVQGVYVVLKDPAMPKEFRVFLSKAFSNTEYREALVTMIDQSIQEWFNVYEGAEPYEQGLMIGELTGQVLSAAVGAVKTASGIKDFIKSDGFVRVLKNTIQAIKTIKTLLKTDVIDILKYAKTIFKSHEKLYITTFEGLDLTISYDEIKVALIADMTDEVADKKLKELDEIARVFNEAIDDAKSRGITDEDELAAIGKGAAEAVSKLKNIFNNINSKLDELFASIKKITKFDNYYEVVTPDGMIVRIERSEVSNISKIDEIAENSAKAESAASRGAFQGTDEIGEAIVDIDAIDDGLGNLDWDAIVSKKGETRIDHINRHAFPKPERASHGVFYNNPVDEVNKAWAKRGTVTPIDDTMGGYIYNIPVENVAYESGTTNTGKIMNYVTIVTKKDTNELFAAFPSFGDYGSQYLK
jgi:hypothetical protein